MTQQVVTVPAQTALASPSVNREQMDLLKRTIARGSTDDEFKVFLEVCQRRKIDPFSKLLYLVKRWDSQARQETMALQSSIDYFRLTAERNGHYAGQVGPQWCGEDEVWKDVWLAKVPPRAARVGVLRSDFKEPLWAVALWDSYVQKKKDGSVTHFWAQMGSLMLGKCAEALAIRRAFPEDLAGLYTADEMAQAEIGEGEEAPHAAQAKPAQPTLAAAAEKRSAPREVKAEVVPAKQEKPAQAVTEQGTVDPWPLNDKVGEPQLGTKGTGYVYQGCFIEGKIVDGYNRWKLYKVETKDQKVNGKPWSEMPFGSPDGARENWLRAVAGWCAKCQQEEGKSNQLGERAAYSLFLMEQKRYHDKMNLLEEQHREDIPPSTGEPLFDESVPF